MPAWWQSAVIYQVWPRSFQDSDGDGVGDLRGIARRLDHLRGLGVDAIWISPIYPSPLADFGYDVADHYGVDPAYGSLGDFVAFTHAAKQRGLRVLIDLVVNHTSDQHRWFQSARSDPDSPYRDWYVWSKEKPATAAEGEVVDGADPHRHRQQRRLRDEQVPVVARDQVARAAQHERRVGDPGQRDHGSRNDRDAAVLPQHRADAR